jgi:hypothetical protein
MEKDEMQLWSEDINQRLKAAQNLSQSDKDKVLLNITDNVPEKPWPYGMPTSVNPYVCVIGTSPGSSPNPNDTRDRALIPTIGEVNQGMRYEDPRGYWNKVRKLCCAITRLKNKNFSEEECLIMSGHLNLSTSKEGKGSNVILKQNIVGWVSNLIFEKIMPLVVILIGNYGKLKKDSHYWNSANGIKIDWKNPQKEIDFYNNCKFRVWIKPNQKNQNVVVISWPTHFGKPPVINHFDEAINETKNIIKEAQKG